MSIAVSTRCAAFTDQRTWLSSDYFHSQQSGLSSGGLGITIGSSSQTDKLDATATTQSQSRSLIGSNTGNLTITAGGSAKVSGSDLVAAKDLSISAKAVTLDPGIDQSKVSESHESRQSGLTLGASGGVIDLAQNVVSQVEGIADTNGDKRVLALRGLTLAAKGGELIDRLGAASQALDAGNLKDAANASGVGISLSIGSSQSKSESVSSTMTNSGATALAGGKLTVTARQGDIDVQGSTLGGKNITLDAAQNIHLEAATDTSSTHSSNSGSSSSLGVGLSSAGLALQFSASQSKGHADGDSATQQNSIVAAQDKLTLKSGADTALTGAQASATRIDAQVGGNLDIASVQDSATYKAAQSSSGVSLSLCVYPLCAGASSAAVSASKSQVDSNYASVNQQSGLFAGQGGFEIQVGGNTDLKGGVIASTADPSQNRLQTATLTTSDIQNATQTKASSSGISASTSMLTSGYEASKGVIGNLMNSGIASQSDASTTKSAIAAGTLVITDDATQKQLTGKGATETIATTNRNTTDTNRTLAKPDIGAVQQAAQDSQAKKMLVFDTFLAVADDGIKKWLDPKLRQDYCLAQPCSNDQEANNRKIAALAQSIQAADTNLSLPQAVQLAIERITDKNADSTLSQSNPNRVVSITNPNSGEEVSLRNIQSIPVTIADIKQLSDEAKQNSTVFVAGTWNPAQRAGELAYQQTPTLDPVTQRDQINATGNNTVGSTYVVHVDKANTVVGETVVAILDKTAEVLGLVTPAAKLAADAVQELSTKRDATGQALSTDIAMNNVGQSRGTLTQVGMSLELASRGFRNDNLSIIANNPAAAEARLRGAGSLITRPQNISIYAPRNDPVSCFVGGYACDVTAAFQTTFGVVMTPNSVHSSGGTGAVGSNSADVNKPFSYSGFDIEALNSARAAQTQAFLPLILNQPSSVIPTTNPWDDIIRQRQQQQAEVNAAMQKSLPRSQAQTLQTPPQVSKPQDSRIDSLKTLQQDLMNPEGH